MHGNNNKHDKVDHYVYYRIISKKNKKKLSSISYYGMSILVCVICVYFDFVQLRKSAKYITENPGVFSALTKWVL